MSRGKLWLAFEALERADQVAALRDLARSIGCSVLDPKSPNAVRLRTHRERKHVGTRTELVPTANGNVSDMPVMAEAIVNSALSSRKTAAKKRLRKPKVSTQPTDAEIGVIRTLNAERLRHVPGDLGYDANDPENIEGLRKVLGRFTVVDCENVIAWWTTRKSEFPGWKAIDHLRPQTVFKLSKFQDYANRARAWKVGRDDVEYDNDALWRETMARRDS